MFRYPSARVACLLAVVVAVGLYGCASAPPPPLPSEADRAGFGTVGVVAARFAPRDVFQTDATIGRDRGALEGALAGMGLGAGESLGAGMEAAKTFPGFYGMTAGSYTVAVTAIFFIPIGITIGAITGAAEAIPESVAERIETCIPDVLLSPDVPLRARDHILAVATRETSHPIVAVEGRGPATPDEAVSYRSLADGGIDTVLEVSILNVGLAGGRGDQFYLQPFFLAQVRLVRVADDTEVFRRAGWYSAEHHPLFELCADDGLVLQTTLDRVYTTMAEAIVEEVFLMWRPGSED
jgi:hypothetical protein